MRIHACSDLHLDITGNEWPAPAPALDDVDVVVVAGDAGAPATLALPQVRALWPDNRIVYVPGNHDYYSDAASPETKTTWEAQRATAPAVAADLGIDWLDDGAVEIDGVRFLGATLWTDFQQRPEFMSMNSAAMGAASRHGMNDYRCIKVGRGRGKDRLRPAQTIAAHRASRAFLDAALADGFDGPTVVVTHHAPLPGAVMRDLEWCYRSDLTALMHGDGAPDLWIHGHIHASSDQVVGRTRVICNPRGYPLHPRPGAPRENTAFDPQFVVEIPSPAPRWRP